MSPDAPSSPVRLPATLKLWQGLPPTTRSAVPRRDLQSTLVTSPRFGTSGNLSRSTAEGNGSTSAKHSASHPSGRQASVAASTPEQAIKILAEKLPLYTAEYTGIRFGE